MASRKGWNFEHDLNVITGPQDQWGQYPILADVHPDRPTEGRIMGAAFDLLAACEALPLNVDFTDAADFKDNAGTFRRAMNLARAAIARAKGETDAPPPA